MSRARRRTTRVSTRTAARRRRAATETNVKKTTTAKRKTASRKKQAPKQPTVQVSKIEYVGFDFALASVGRDYSTNTTDLKGARLYKTSEKEFTLHVACGSKYKLNIENLKKVIEEAEKLNVTSDLLPEISRY